VSALSAGCLQQTLVACRSNNQLCYCSFDTAPTDIFKLASDASSKCTAARLQEPGVPTCVRSVVLTLNQCSSGGQNALFTCTRSQQSGQTGQTVNMMALAQCILMMAPTLQVGCIPALASMYSALIQAGQAAMPSSPTPPTRPGWPSTAPTDTAWPFATSTPAAPIPPLQSRPPRQGARPAGPQGAPPEWDGRWSTAATVMTTIGVILALAATGYLARRVLIARRVRQMQGQEMASGGLRASGPVVVGQVV